MLYQECWVVEVGLYLTSPTIPWRFLKIKDLDIFRKGVVLISVKYKFYFKWFDLSISVRKLFQYVYLCNKTFLINLKN